ncbi:MAG: hypothetical protein DRR04_05725 [Gammaproteobacteria bacterium]|nr:MAG: hypothetical protein DRQ97_07190 [Gammaproteobacteria bacterium]RLA60424.1 MAG: hypothetical protein DRR04_05725 [Gammaproteobacteria bacterium]
MQYLVQMEQDELVDEWSSRALKRLLYMTERRIRYASSPVLRENSAVAHQTLGTRIHQLIRRRHGLAP